MSSQTPDSMHLYLYSGGLAETVSRPTTLTFSFISHWFRGSTSLGKAMELLGLPYEKCDEPVVCLKDGELFVDLQVEERTLYSGTIFAYKPQTTPHTLPSLGVRYHRLLVPRCLMNTLKIILYQSELISSPEKAVARAKDFISQMPEVVNTTTISATDSVLTEKIWPYVIAIGALSEFYSRLLEQEIKSADELSVVLSSISSQVAANDWFITSLSHQAKVREGKMSYDEYLEHYGIRGRKDYEIACPRWYEERDVLYKHISKGDSVERAQTPPAQFPLKGKGKHYSDAVIHLQILRSEARRRALIWVDVLRKQIVHKVGKDMEYFTREDLLAETTTPAEPITPTIQEKIDTTLPTATEGKGMAVSVGMVSGKALHIQSSFDEVPKGTIGIFPNASTDFTMLYNKCAGIIFLAGGQTSHGAIVSREFKIPAIVAGDARNVIDGTEVSIDGQKGSWTSH